MPIFFHIVIWATVLVLTIAGVIFLFYTWTEGIEDFEKGYENKGRAPNRAIARDEGSFLYRHAMGVRS